ncbi:uncharacterized protein C8Q71DRAFT_380425 [Rhodofomes roseus]|uniref:Uncharacterized protein n=1 Tax=Rhodofomes roseus TaxID=34475 RepID=A0ABQ8K146_9APHY|nr:uncharacterized protein C8Q71DRAFT_380425 [Rhodofomes roseus]KAH9830151.1 hypothetical protein C8Q71DRAFT_380425 [Rhodofomes roseus]
MWYDSEMPWEIMHAADQATNTLYGTSSFKLSSFTRCTNWTGQDRRFNASSRTPSGTIAMSVHFDSNIPPLSYPYRSKTMSGSKHELAPGAIAGIVIGTLLVLVVLSATGILLFHRRRVGFPATPHLPSSSEKPAPLSKTPQRRVRRAPSRKPSPSLRLTADLVSFPKPLARAGRDLDKDCGNTSVSTLNVVISPSLPRIFKVDTEDGEGAAVEVRVTPPTPVASRGDLGMPSPTKGRPLRKKAPSGIGLGMVHLQGEGESKWWAV